MTAEPGATAEGSRLHFGPMAFFIRTHGSCRKYMTAEGKRQGGLLRWERFLCFAYWEAFLVSGSQPNRSVAADGTVA